MTDVFTNDFAYNIFKQRYSMDGQESWRDLSHRVVENVCGQYLNNEDKNALEEVIYERKFIPAGRYLYSAGRAYHMVCNCFAFRAKDTREGWGDLLNKTAVTSMSGGGIGVVYSGLRSKNSILRRTGGVSSGPIPLIHAVNESNRYIRQGGHRRGAIWGGLAWWHDDIFDFMDAKNYSDEDKSKKLKDIDYPLPLDGTNISVIYDTEFFIAMKGRKHPKHKHAKAVWDHNCEQAFSTAEPGFAFNWLNDNEDGRNACTEFTTEDDSDRCNLGTVWINRIADREELARVIDLGTKFLICGGAYSDMPTEKSKEVGEKNNKIGLGLGGIHEWMIERGHGYHVTPELHKWLNVYEQESDGTAYVFAKEIGVNIPQKKRAIAPNGTIGILAESSTGIEPIFCKSYKRRYMENGEWKYTYVVDGAVKRLVEKGIDVNTIEDAFDISFEQRVKVQADVQQYVDMAISSTCNLPEWGSEENNEDTLKKNSKILLKHAKRLRGFTCYPDGCRSGQPLTRVDINTAMEQEGFVFEEKEDRCAGGGVCGV